MTRKPTRAQVLDLIRVECAEEGRITGYATRLYVENRISYAAFMKAARLGLAQRRANNNPYAGFGK